MPPKPAFTPAGRCFLAVASVYTLVFLLQLHCAPHRELSPQEQGVPPLPTEDQAVTDDASDAGPLYTPSPRMPDGPLPWQKTPPCDVDMAETAVNGACYIIIGRSPPCGPKLIEHQGRCFRSIAKAPRQPVSGQE